MSTDGLYIQSLLEDDIYKLTMGQAAFRYPRLSVRYGFVNRGKTEFPRGFADVLRKQVEGMAELQMLPGEKQWLTAKCGHYLKPNYLDWFAGYRYNPDEVRIQQRGGDLRYWIEGPLYRTIYWEVPLMATTSELYYEMAGQKPKAGWLEKAAEKGRTLRAMKALFAIFGLRRRQSYFVEDEVTKILIEAAGKFDPMGGLGGVLRGTSNVHMAMKHGLTPIGTHAHEWFEIHAAMFGFYMATPMALKAWTDEFEGQLGIALTDTYTTDKFLLHFGPVFARLFDGVRQDSGDPLVSLEKVIAHYQRLFIDPTTKTFVASDGLDVEKVKRIQEAARGRIRTLYGIGTNLTNDVGLEPLNIVIKLFQVTLPNGEKVPVLKLSDDIGKVTGDRRALKRAVLELGIDPKLFLEHKK